MNEPTLTDAERRAFWQAMCEWNDIDDGFGRDVPSNAVLYAAVARIVVEAVDRERAAWATKVADAWDEGVDYCEEIAGVGYNPVGTHDANPYRGLLAADDTEEIHPSVQWVADAIAAAVSADDTEGKP